MFKIKSLLVWVGLILITACGRQTDASFESFFDRIPQEIRERNIMHALTPEWSLSLTDRGIYSISSVDTDDEHLLFIDQDNFRVLKVDKETGEIVGDIDYREGRGPGEVLRQQMLLHDGKIVIADTQNLKFVYFSKQGAYLEERLLSYGAEAIIPAGDDRIVLYSSYLTDSLFTVLDDSLHIISAFEQGRVGIEEALKYTGRIAADNEGVYYAAYSEPYLRGYTFDGEILFSRSTIDNYDLPADQYQTERMDNGFNVAGFGPNAIHSTREIKVDQGFLYLLPISNDEEMPYIDLYEKETGTYSQSFQLPHQPVNLVADGSYLFVTRRDSLGDTYIEMYENPVSGM